MAGSSHHQDTLSALTRYTRQRVILVEIFNQICLSVLGFAAFIAIKTLDANKTEAVILTNGNQIAFIFAYIFSTLMAGKAKKPFLIIAGIATRLCMIACIWVSDSTSFTIILCIAFLGVPVYLPALNALGQSNYRPEHRGRVTGTIAMWSIFAFILVTLFVGGRLQEDPEAFQWLFPAAGLCGFIAYLIAACTRFRSNRSLPTRKLSRAAHDLVSILQSNIPFFKFQICFFIYGVGFMICMPTNVIVITQELNMTYQEFAIGVVICGFTFIALCAPLAGKLFDKLGPTSSCAISFTVLALHPLCMVLALEYMSMYLVYVAYAFFGIGISGVNQSWANGPMYYAGKEDSAVYMGIHMSNVGLRAIIGSIIVIFANQVSADGGQFIAHQVIYIVSISFFIIAALCMYALKAAPSRRL